MKYATAIRCAVLASLCMAMASLVARADNFDFKSGSSSATKSKPNDKSAASETVAWSSSLNDGYRRAMADHKPVFVYAGAKWCPTCRKISTVIESAKVREELARWTPIYLDIDAQRDDATTLGITAVPALRIHTPGGQAVAKHDQLVTADELVKWLKQNYSAATAAADDVLLAAGEPSAAAAAKLVKQFEQQNAAMREAAIRRLLPFPNTARPFVVKAFRDGPLSARLAAFELLEQWKAPLADLDPWRPETLTKERLAKLDKWTESKPVGEPSRPTKLSEKELTDAQHQMTRMLAADESEADAIRQRLARLGPALLPEVYKQLKNAATDQDRRRLLVLRYRLAAPDSLVLRWPGGVERLGDTDPKLRRQAAEQLAKLAGNPEKELLLELFADSDPLVREISLRGLQHIGGKAASTALVKLLGDPEPNVRAAVLKQLEESPNAAMVPAVVKYIKEEKDPDLIVHGICFLRAAKGVEAAKCLIALLKHESWQVRAEAAIGIGKLNDHSNSFSSDDVTYNSSNNNANEAARLQADAYVALIDLLGDNDAFVVAKAVEGLADADMVAAVEPLVKVANKHPELAANVMTMLAGKSSMRSKAIPHFRKFCKHENPKVRAAAIESLCLAASNDAADELLATLDDKESEVRLAAAQSLFRLMNRSRETAKNRSKAVSAAVPSSGIPYAVSETVVVQEPAVDVGGAVLQGIADFFGGSAKKKQPPTLKVERKKTLDTIATDGDQKTKAVDPPKPTAKSTPPAVADSSKPAADKKKDAVKPAEEKSEQDQWLEDWYAGRDRGRPKWTAKTVAPLEKMLAAKDAKERMAAALALIPLGKADAALPVVLDTVRANADLMDEAAAALPWLGWKQRYKLFADLQKMATGSESRAQLVRMVSDWPDPRAASPLWDILADSKKTDKDDASSIHTALMMTYFGERYYSSSNISMATRRAVVKAAKPKAASGSETQRLVAVAILAQADREEAAAAAVKLADDPKVSESVRTDALQIQLMTQPGREAKKSSIAAMKGKDVLRKKLAMRYLVQGANGLRSLQSGFYLYLDTEATFTSTSSGTPIVPKPIEGVAAEDVRPLLNDSDPEVAATAGYLLALLGEPDGMDALIRYWRQHSENYSEWNKYMYRAIAVIDDPKHIPILKEIYGKLQQHEVSEFYWTIRIMSGPEILAFRKQIRDERGAQLGQ
jgi:HEAT repeat protein/thiol-disulfide isomerase/thioredoxin